MSAEAKALISQLLQPDPQARPTAAEALRHPWLRGAAPRRRVSTHIASDLSAYQTRMRTKLRAGLYVSLAASSFQSRGRLQRKSDGNVVSMDVNGRRVADVKPRASLPALVAAQQAKASWGEGVAPGSAQTADSSAMGGKEEAGAGGEEEEREEEKEEEREKEEEAGGNKSEDKFSASAVGVEGVAVSVQSTE